MLNSPSAHIVDNDGDACSCAATSWPARADSHASPRTLPRTTRASSRPTPQRDRVWIVDDSPLELELSRSTLSSRFDVEAFADGASMLERLAHAGPPDVILLDWQMPHLSGLDVCRFVRQSIDEARLPIVILTGMHERMDLVEGLDAGANDYVTKPYLPEELLARVATLVRTKRLHEKLERAEEALRLEGEVRERFIGILGHDLRQPLNALLITGHMLASRASTPEDASTMGIVLRATQRMQRMIAELLDFTRIRQGGGMPVTLGEGDIHRIVGQVIEELRLANVERRVSLTVTGRGTGRWDHDRIAQLSANLVGNALEHSPAGTPVEVEIREASGGVTLEVTNEGPRIPPELLPSIFDPFKHGARTHSQGLGLGLFIAEKIVLAHAGSIAVESDDSRTSFRVRLPVR
jgi:signal transduction histidine kinase